MATADGENTYTPEPLLPFHTIENKRYLYLAMFAERHGAPLKMVETFLQDN